MIGSVNRRALVGLIGGQIRFGDEPAAGFHLGHDLVGNGAGVKGVRTALGNLMERLGQVKLH